MRIARILSLVLVIAALAAVPVRRAGAAPSRATVVYLYQGSERGQESLYGFVSVFKPYALYGHRAWMWRWTVRCVRTASLFVGADLGCQGRASIQGWARDSYLYDPSQNCTATITTIPGVKWRIGAYYAGGTKIRISAGAPLADRVIRPNPVDSGCGPNDAINWLGDIDTTVVSPLLDFTFSGAAGGFDAVDRTVSGTYQHGTANFNSQLFIRLKSLTTVPTGLLGQWADQLAGWLTQQQDQQANQSVIHAPLDIEVPANGTLSGKGVPVTGNAGSGAADTPGPLFTIHQRLRAGVLTPLQIRLTATGRSLLGGAARLPKLKITLKFSPRHGRARTVTRTITPPAPLPPIPAG